MQVRLTQLYKSVWEPLAGHLVHAKPINIAPTGMLHAVPWATLRQRDGRYLCQVADEVRILALLGNFPATSSSSELLSCGVSEAPANIRGGEHFPFDQRFADLVGSLPALPGVTKELQAIGGNPLINPTKKTLLSSLANKPGALHLAGHGFVLESEEGHGFRAGFVLGGGGRENILFAHEIAQLDLTRTDLVVLSACRGGIGQNEVGGNWSSLRRAFIAAGVRHVLAAQWRVRDDELPEFMSQFHEKRKSTSPAQALWQLQRTWLENEENGDEAMRAASAGAWLIESVQSN
ncbi:CHAT domain-containing protein [Akkermansiaceae bacterium]|nr:CHAT domain-containing protein [Akkermansiaceae bacterium]